MYDVSTQGVDERKTDVHYYCDYSYDCYELCLFTCLPVCLV